MWVKKEPEFACQIRVNRGLYFHHGIFLSPQCVVHFASPNDDGMLSPESARVIETSLDVFLKGGELEIRQYSSQEQEKLRKPTEIANYALSCLGNAGYDLVNNNCEHFSNECAFGEKKSDQVNDIVSKLMSFVR